MASRLSTEPPSRPDQGRPEPGQILLVIHDFSARSSDELSLYKGDRVELIERDDDFGDGWYLGRHLTKGTSGLFPEVYTRIAPRGPPSYPPTSTTIPRSHPGPFEKPKQPAVQSSGKPSVDESSNSNGTRKSSPTEASDRTPHVSLEVKPAEASESSMLSAILSPFNSTAAPDPDRVVTGPKIPPSTMPIQPKAVNAISAPKSHAHGQDSPVMNETLSVIDEHITDMHSPHHSVVAERRGTNDSGSEYSSHFDPRLSYINGEETDEEEEDEPQHTREEVAGWTPDRVAEYLFTVGVEAKHCEVFRDQEITGDVLLGMDQTSVFLKEFDLGSVGRRLKTWQKVKSLQDEVNGDNSTRRNTAVYGSEVGSDDTGRNRSRSNTSLTKLPRISSMMDRPGSNQNARPSQKRVSKTDPPPTSVISPKILDNPRPFEQRRPSAASVRDMHHSRQNSENNFGTVSIITSPSAESLDEGSSEGQDKATHKKQPSFDRNWTMASAPTSTVSSRPLSSAGLKSIVRSSTDYLAQITAPANPFDSLDRGYFSGGEAEGRARNVLRKRGSTATHSRNSSYADEQRVRTATAHSRHSRFGSVDSIREPGPPSAAQKYYGLPTNGRRRSPSENSIIIPSRPLPPAAGDTISPTVTKLAGSPYDGITSPISPDTRQTQGAEWLLPTKTSRAFGLRAISDAVTGHERSRVVVPADQGNSPAKDSPVQSPSRTESSTPSAGPSFELDSPDAKNTSAATTPGSARASRKKSKKETSAYTRGLEKKTPREQMIGADYSGWMKKKSTNLMTTWKPRLFVLKGRRLSYYYSEDDDQEKGLIDISFHRVLPADTDRLTGLHATLTGATSSPTSPSGAHAPTIASMDEASEPQSSLSKGSGDSMFIFKLVPPRAGLSRAVTFTKPTVHYFAVPNVKQGRLWMAALMKATIDRDDTTPITTTYQQKTISLAKARAMRHRPPALMNLDEKADEETMKTPDSDRNGLNIQGIIFDSDPQEGDSGVSGLSKLEMSTESAKGTLNKFLGRGLNGAAVQTEPVGPRSA